MTTTILLQKQAVETIRYLTDQLVESEDKASSLSIKLADFENDEREFTLAMNNRVVTLGGVVVCILLLFDVFSLVLIVLISSINC